MPRIISKIVIYFIETPDKNDLTQLKSGADLFLICYVVKCGLMASGGKDAGKVLLGNKFIGSEFRLF